MNKNPDFTEIDKSLYSFLETLSMMQERTEELANLSKKLKRDMREIDKRYARLLHRAVSEDFSDSDYGALSSLFIQRIIDTSKEINDVKKKWTPEFFKKVVRRWYKEDTEQ